MTGKVHSRDLIHIGDLLWMRGNLEYVNEAFGTEFAEPAEAAIYVRSYNSDAALLKDTTFDEFVRLHEQGDACVIIDRFVVFNRMRYGIDAIAPVVTGHARHRMFDESLFAL